DVPPAQCKFGTSESTSSKCCRPAALSTSDSSTVTLAGTSTIDCCRSVAVTMTSSTVGSTVPAACAPSATKNPEAKTTKRIPDLLCRRAGYERNESSRNQDDGRRTTCSLRRY